MREVTYKYVDYEQTFIWVRDFINDRCIARIPSGEKRLKGKPEGKFYDWQFYLNVGFWERDFTEAFAHLFWWKMKAQYEKEPFQLGSVASAGIPMALAIMNVGYMEYGITVNAFNIRKEQKTYGLCNWLEGTTNNLPVLLVDDIFSSGNSLNRVTKICEDEGLIVGGRFTLINKNKSWKTLRNDKNHYLYNIEDFDLHFEDWDDEEYKRIMNEVFLQNTKEIFDGG